MEGSKTYTGTTELKRKKHTFSSIAERNRTVERLLDIFQNREEFLLLGHEQPDEDCISSLVSMALLIRKFNKSVTIFIRDQIPAQMSYLTNICSYNEIPVYQDASTLTMKPDVLCILDTPKPDMIAAAPEIEPYLHNPDIPVIEIDHHLSADAEYAGTPGLCLVNRASSTCELIGFICCKISRKPELLSKYDITNLFSRNLVLSMLTGMIGDTKFGLTLKKDRDIFFYNYFSTKFSGILQQSVHKNSGNYASMTDIFRSLEKLSADEKDLHQKLLERAHYFGRTGYVILDPDASYEILDTVEYSLFVKVIKSVTDFLSEKSGTIGLTGYYDPEDVSDLIQFRIRTARAVSGMDLRNILKEFSIEDGGGHPGAIGFRISRDKLSNPDQFVKNILEQLEKL